MVPSSSSLLGLGGDPSDHWLCARVSFVWCSCPHGSLRQGPLLAGRQYTCQVSSRVRHTLLLQQPENQAFYLSVI